MPHSVWDTDFSPFAAAGSSPDEIFEYQAMLGYAAARTQGMRLGVGVTEAIRRHPLVLAQTFLTLSHLNDAPVILGLGAGERENLDPVGLSFERPVSRLEEAVRIIRMAFDNSGPIDFEGEHFQFDGALMDLRAGPVGTPRIWIAALGPRMLRIAGREADGWYPTGITNPAEYRDRLTVIAEAAVGAGRDPAAITPGLQVFAVIDEDRDRARERLEADPVRLMSLLMPARQWHALGATHPLGDDFGGLVDFVPQLLDRDAARSALAAVPEAVLERTALWGTPQDMIAAASDLAEAGLRHLVIHDVPALPSSPPGTPSSRFETIRAIRREVLV